MTAHACRRCKGTCPATNPEWEGHGKPSSYDNHRCRCGDCTEANRERFRARRRNNPSARTPQQAAIEREAALSPSDRAIRAMRGWDTRRANQQGSAA